MMKIDRLTHELNICKTKLIEKHVNGKTEEKTR